MSNVIHEKKSLDNVVLQGSDVYISLGTMTLNFIFKNKTSVL